MSATANNQFARSLRRSIAPAIALIASASWFAHSAPRFTQALADIKSGTPKAQAATEIVAASAQLGPPFAILLLLIAGSFSYCLNPKLPTPLVGAAFAIILAAFAGALWVFLLIESLASLALPAGPEGLLTMANVKTAAGVSTFFLGAALAKASGALWSRIEANRDS